MEHLAGGDLHRAVLERAAVVARPLEVLIRVAEALAFAHGRGLVHRDVKPSNVLLDEAGSPRLADFDLVAAADTTGGTRTGVLGTVVYSAPEALERPQDADARADVYGLGMTALFLLRGKEIPLGVLRDIDRILRDAPCSDAVRSVLGRALAWEREHRFEDAGRLCAALRAAVDPAPPGVAPLLRSAAQPFHLRRSRGVIFELRPRPEDFQGRSSPGRGKVAQLVRDAWAAGGVLSPVTRDLFLLALAEGRRDVAVIALAVEDVEPRRPGAAGGAEGPGDAGPSAEGTTLVIMSAQGSAAGWEIWTAADPFWAAHRARVQEAIEADGISPLRILSVDPEALTGRIQRVFSGVAEALPRLDEAAPVLDAFVEPAVREAGAAAPAFSALDAWLSSEIDTLLLLGPHGSGKSVLLAAFRRALSRRPGGPLPIVAELAGAVDGRDPEGWLLDAAGMKEGEANRAALRLLLRKRMVVACFDGLDERPLGREETILDRLSMLAQVSGGEGKIVITARPHHLSGAASASAEGLLPRGLRRLEIEPLDERRAQEILGRALGGPGQARDAWRRIVGVEALAPLVCLPRMLAILIASWRRRGLAAIIGAEEVYEEFLEGWLERTGSGAYRAFSPQARRALAEALAEELFRSGRASAAWAELRTDTRQRIEGMLAGQLTPEAAIEELRDGALLERDGDGSYRFAHAPIRSWFLVRALASSIADRPPVALATCPLDAPVLAALHELLRRAGDVRGAPVVVAAGAFLSTARDPVAAAGEGAEAALARANALRVLVGLARAEGEPAGWVPDGADLRGARLEGKRLRGVRLVRAQLGGAELSGADLREADLSGADLGGARLVAAMLDGAVLRGASLRRTDLTAVSGDGCVLEGADLSEAVLRQSVWTRCDLGGASFRGADVTACVLPDSAGGAGATVSPRWLEATLALYVEGRWSTAWDAAGVRVASGSYYGALTIWEAASGVLLARLGDRCIPSWRDPDHRDLAWDPGGARLAAIGPGRCVRVWNVALGREEFVLVHRVESPRAAAEASEDEREERHDIFSAAWDGRGERLATGGADGVRIWDAACGEELAQLRREYSWRSEYNCRLAWHDSGSFILVGGDNGGADILDIRSGRAKPQCKLEDVSRGTARAVVWRGGEARFAVGDAAGRISIGEVTGKGSIQRIAAHQGKVQGLAFDGEGRIASSGEDSSVRVWEVGSGREVARISEHRGEIAALAFDAPGERLAVGDSAANLRVWDARSGRERARMAAPTGSPSALAWGGEGARLAVGNFDGSIQIWDGRSGRVLSSWSAGARCINELAWDPQGSRLASAAGDGTVRIWEVSSREESARLEHEHVVHGVAWDPAGRCVASCTVEGPFLWEVRSRSQRPLWRERLAQMRQEPFMFPECRRVRLDPSGTRLAGGMADGMVRLWDIATGTEIGVLKGHSPSIFGGVEALAWGPDGQRLASGGWDGTARIWDTTSGTELQCLQGHLGPILSVAWDPAGARLASGSWDQTVRLWDVASGREVSRLQAHTDEIHVIDWEPRGHRLASAGADGTVRVWDASAARLLCTLEAIGSRSVAQTPGGYCRFEDGDGSGTPFYLAARRPDRSSSSLMLPLAGLRPVLHRPDKVEAALLGDLSGDEDLERELAAHGLGGGVRWDGERHVL